DLPRHSKRRHVRVTRSQGRESQPATIGYRWRGGRPGGRDVLENKTRIRWTGMPAWKDELSDQQIWTLALFLRHMDKLPPGPEATWRSVKIPRASVNPQ